MMRACPIVVMHMILLCIATAPGALGTKAVVLKPQNGMELLFDIIGTVERVTCDQKALTSTGPGGFFIREYAKSDAYQPIPCRIETRKNSHHLRCRIGTAKQ